MEDVIESKIRWVSVSEEDLGDRVLRKLKNRVADPKNLEEKAKKT